MRDVITALLGLSASDLGEETRKNYRNFAAAKWETAACLLAMEQSRGYSVLGYGSLYQYAEMHLGMHSHTTAELLRVARALVDLPNLSAAVREGKVNWTKAREISRVADARSEEQWVKYAQTHSTHEVARRIVKSPRQQKKEQQRRAEGRPGPAGSGNSPTPGSSPHSSTTNPGIPDGGSRTGDETKHSGQSDTDEGKASTGPAADNKLNRGMVGSVETDSGSRNADPANVPGQGKATNGREGNSSSTVEEPDLFAGSASDEVSSGSQTGSAPTPCDRNAEGSHGADARPSHPERDEVVPNGENGSIDRNDEASDIPEESQLTSLRFVVSGVQMKLFEMAEQAVKARHPRIRRRENVLEELCRMFLATLGASTSSRIRSTLVIYRDADTGASWVETDRGPMRVGIDDVKRVAATGEVVRMAGSPGQGGLPTEILETTTRPRKPRESVDEILAMDRDLPSPETVPDCSRRGVEEQTSSDLLAQGQEEQAVGNSAAEGASTPSDAAAQEQEEQAVGNSAAEGASTPSDAAAQEQEEQAVDHSPGNNGHSDRGAAPVEWAWPATRTSCANDEPNVTGTPGEPCAQTQPEAEVPSGGRGVSGEPAPIEIDSDPRATRTSPGGKSSSRIEQTAWHRGKRIAIPAGVYRGLWLRSGGRCENPGCGRRGTLHAHHDDAYSEHPHHDLDRMRLLCSQCHARVHEHDFATRPDWAAARARNRSRSTSRVPDLSASTPLP